ncbi:MAG: hypothetical protein ABIH39_02505 [Candidatus Margulisiibacteriota bacterium]
MIEIKEAINSLFDEYPGKHIPARLYSCLAYCYQRLFSLTGDRLYIDNRKVAFLLAMKKDRGNVKARKGLAQIGN